MLSKSNLPCSNSNYNNTSSVSTHKRMLAVNGRNLKTQVSDLDFEVEFIV